MKDKRISNMSSAELWIDFRKTESLDTTMKFREILALENIELLLWKSFPLN